MPSQGRKRVGGTVAAERNPGMAVVVRNVPKGHNWGWHAREDQRMHLQSVDEQHDYKVWLEKDGERIFEPAGVIPPKVAKVLREYVGEHRLFVEDRWVRFMMDKGWIHLHIALPKLTLVAYPNMPAKFVREVDLTTWFDRRQLDSLRPEIIQLNREMAALRIWADRPEDDTYDARLSRLLWGKELSGR
jgi:hypothetical protein